MDVEFRAWIFVSHSSDDLPRAREVRNYLESKGASPLLFHLKALANPEEFWPIIEREIAARNFFLYCQSAVADGREWVRREREAVEREPRNRPIRVDSIRVDRGDLDFSKLDDFLAKTRVFPSFTRSDREVARPFLLAMERAGFQVFDEREITAGEVWRDRIQRELEAAARDGWVVAFFSRNSIESGWVGYEIGFGVQAGAKFIPVLSEQVSLPDNLLRDYQLFDATVDPTTAPDRLVELMLLR
jgi:hypothetical protein